MHSLTAATPAGAFGIYAIVAGLAWLFTWEFLPGAFCSRELSGDLPLDVFPFPQADKRDFVTRPPAETKGLTLEEVRAVFEREVNMDGRSGQRGTAADSMRAPSRSALGDGNDADLDAGGRRDGYHVIGDGDGDEDESDLEQDSREADADVNAADPSEAEGEREPGREHSGGEEENCPGPSSVVSRIGLET